MLNDVPYFGGHFLKFDGTVVAQLVRADPATGALDTTWLPQVTAGLLGVFAIDAYDPTKLYVGGDFTRVEGLKRTNFAEFTDGAAPADAGVSLSLAGPSSGTVGQNIAYTAAIVNAGPDTALNTVVTDVLPVGLDFVSAPGCTYADVNRTVTCNLGAATTAGASVRITVTPTASGTLANTVSVDSSTNDPNPGDTAGTVTTAVASAGGADLGVSTAVAAKVTKGAAFSLVLTVVNHGPLASAATVVDDLPDNAVPNGGATSSQGSCSGGPVKVTCALGPLAAGARATITIPLKAPGAPQTIENTATVTGSVADPVAADDVSTTAITVTSGSASDKTAPKMTGMTMLDPDHDGYVDTVVVNFNEALAACPGNCAKGWVLTGVPSGGSLKSVAVSGRTATLTLGGWTDDPDTSVGLFDVALNNANAIQDAAGNHSSFAATQPADGASPVPVGFRHQHNSGAPCRTLPATLGLAEQCDELTSEWSEPLLPSSIPATTNFTITDPAGAGDQTASIPGFSRGPFDLGSGGYLTLDAVSASWPSSLLVLDSAGDALTVRIFGACQGSGCNALAVVRDVTVTYVPAMTITDAAGNPAAGSVSKTQTMF